MDDSKKDRQNELDRFWDISALLPQKKTPSSNSHRSTETVEITVERHGVEDEYKKLKQVTANDVPILTIKPESKNTGVKVVSADNELLVKKFIPPYTAEEFALQPKPDDEYKPQHNLIHKVKIFNWKTSYNYYEQFLRHARKIKNISVSECSRVPFFSYVPQFSQLSRQQLAWYLWWRACAVKGEYLKTDYSYILLFIYEIINTGGHGNPAWGQTQLFGLWGAYREEFPRFDKMLGEWICDFSLIFHLPSPELLPRKIPVEAVQTCSLKEFYMSEGDGSDCGYCNMLLTFCSNYDYRTSKFAKGDVLKLYNTHIRGALAETVKRFSKNGEQLLSGAGLEDSHVVRDAFAGALCSFEVKKRIDVEYCSFSRTHELRFLVTDIIKYSENKIRAYMGIKSRLSVYALPVIIRECIDSYFLEVLPKKHKPAEQEVHDYDKYYDMPVSIVSMNRAAEIEQTSWETTEKLIEAFEENENINHKKKDEISPVDELIEDTQNEMNIVNGIKNEAYSGTLKAVLGELFEFVKLADKHDYEAQNRFANMRGELPDFIADRINGIAADIIGDIILTDEGEGYSFINDYRKDVFDD